MSAYGPCLFVARTDKQPIPEPEQQAIVELVKQHAKTLKLKNSEGETVSPRFYVYGEGYEPDAVGVLISSSYIFSQMPDEIRKDHEDGECNDALKIGNAINRDQPGVYEFKSYMVED